MTDSDLAQAGLDNTREKVDVGPRGAKHIGGIWFPENEEHLLEIMGPGGKQHRPRDGRWTYQIHKLDAAMERIPANRRRVAIDIGAHIGLWSMWLTRAFNHVEAFEPVPLYADLLGWNVTDSNYTLHRCGLSDQDDEARLIIHPWTTGHSHVLNSEHREPIPAGAETTETIFLRTLDCFGFEDVDFIKIDVEGFEARVIRGAMETLRRCKPFIVIEQKGNDAAVYGGKRDEAVELLKSLGARDLKVISGDHIMGF